MRASRPAGYLVQLLTQADSGYLVRLANAHVRANAQPQPAKLKRFKCDWEQCNACFTDSSKLERHKSRCHTGNCSTLLSVSNQFKSPLCICLPLAKPLPLLPLATLSLAGSVSAVLSVLSVLSCGVHDLLSQEFVRGCVQWRAAAPNSRSKPTQRDI